MGFGVYTALNDICMIEVRLTKSTGKTKKGARERQKTAGEKRSRTNQDMPASTEQRRKILRK